MKRNGLVFYQIIDAYIIPIIDHCPLRFWNPWLHSTYFSQNRPHSSLIRSHASVPRSLSFSKGLIRCFQNHPRILPKHFIASIWFVTPLLFLPRFSCLFLAGRILPSLGFLLFLFLVCLLGFCHCLLLVHQLTLLPHQYIIFWLIILFPTFLLVQFLYDCRKLSHSFPILSLVFLPSFIQLTFLLFLKSLPFPVDLHGNRFWHWDPQPLLKHFLISECSGLLGRQPRWTPDHHLFCL